MGPTVTNCLERLAALHPRLCPRQVLGVRMGLHAADLLNLDMPRSDKRVLVLVETDGCFADGISVATGCWFGRRTLRLVDHGKPAATFVDTRSSRAVRVWPDSHSRSRAEQYAPEQPSRWHAQLEAYKVMPVAELLRSAWVELDVPPSVLVGQPGVHATCERCAEEILNGREIIVDGKVWCRACGGETYWRQGSGAIR